MIGGLIVIAIMLLLGCVVWRALGDEPQSPAFVGSVAMLGLGLAFGVKLLLPSAPDDSPAPAPQKQLSNDDLRRLLGAAPTPLATAIDADADADGANEAAGAIDKQTLQYWPQWRGPLATGVAPKADPPVEWGDNKNIRWKVELPGKGHSTPVIWGDRIFLTAAEPVGDAIKPRYSGRPGAHDNLPVSHRQHFIVMAVSRRTGKLLWQKTVRQALPAEGGHVSASLASNSAVTDGQRVYAFFGSHGLYCLDVDGNPVWDADLGDMQTKHGHGEGASPALFGDTLVVNWDHEGQSFIVALDKRTGKQRWKTLRDEVTSWSTPIVVMHAGKPQVVVPGTKRVRSYDLSNGKELWECGGMSANIVASPVAADGLVFVGSSYYTRTMMAIRLAGAKGDITDTEHVVWARHRGSPYVPSPLLYGDALYYHTHYQNVLSRIDTKTGQGKPGPFRLDGIGNVYASPVAAAGRVYITDLSGVTMVLLHGAEPKVLAMNRLNDSFSASAALVGRELYLRGQKHLYCIAEDK